MNISLLHQHFTSFEDLIKIIISNFRFYFPNGNPTGKLSVDAVCKKFSEAFSKNKNSCVTTEQLGQELKVRND